MICAGCGMDTERESGLCTGCAAALMRQGLSYLPTRTTNMEDSMESESQKKKILRHLETFGSIDPVQALQEYGIFRLAARIDELRREAYPIETHTVSSTNRWGEEVRYGRYVLSGRV